MPHLVLVDMRQGPVVVALGVELFERAGRVVRVGRAAFQRRVRHADVEVPRDRRVVTGDQVLGHRLGLEAAAMQSHLELVDQVDLGLLGRERLDVGRQAELERHLALGVVVAEQQVDRDAGLVQTTHPRAEVQASAEVGPSAVVEVAGDHDEIDLLLDGHRDEFGEGVAGGVARLLGRRVLVGAQADQWAIDVVFDHWPPHRKPVRNRRRSGLRRSRQRSAMRHWPDLPPRGAGATHPATEFLNRKQRSGAAHPVAPEPSASAVAPGRRRPHRAAQAFIGLGGRIQPGSKGRMGFLAEREHGPVEQRVLCRPPGRFQDEISTCLATRLRGPVDQRARFPGIRMFSVSRLSACSAGVLSMVRVLLGSLAYRNDHVTTKAILQLHLPLISATRRLPALTRDTPPLDRSCPFKTGITWDESGLADSARCALRTTRDGPVASTSVGRPRGSRLDGQEEAERDAQKNALPGEPEQGLNSLSRHWASRRPATPWPRPSRCCRRTCH